MNKMLIVTQVAALAKDIEDTVDEEETAYHRYVIRAMRNDYHQAWWYRLDLKISFSDDCIQIPAVRFTGIANGESSLVLRLRT